MAVAPVQCRVAPLDKPPHAHSDTTEGNRMLTTPLQRHHTMSRTKAVAAERFPLPTLATLTHSVHSVWELGYTYGQEAGDNDKEGHWMDVRLQTFGSERITSKGGCWRLSSGSADYDQAHGDYIASSSIDTTRRPTKKGAERIARALLFDIRQMIAQ